MILHFLEMDTFGEPFIDFVERNFDLNEHLFLVLGAPTSHATARKNVIRLPGSMSRCKKLIILSRYLNKADKVIFHGLFNFHVQVCFLLQPWLLKRGYWLIWGADLYAYRKPRVTLFAKLIHRVRAFTIRHVGHCVTSLKGDYALAQEWYGATGRYHKCYLYPSNLFCSVITTVREKQEVINVLVGNSADPSNNHLEVLTELKRFADLPVRIYCPLSYGDRNYADIVAKRGAQLFGERFVALRAFMARERYLAFLSNIDIAIFAHERQQAMGITITLLGFGKKVFMRNDVSQWKFFREMGITVYDVSVLDLSPMDQRAAQDNREIVAREFTEAHLRAQWQEIFTSSGSVARKSN